MARRGSTRDGDDNESPDPGRWMMPHDEIGRAEEGATIACPYCGAPTRSCSIRQAAGDRKYVEDCQVCCQPWNVLSSTGVTEPADVDVSAARRGITESRTPDRRPDHSTMAPGPLSAEGTRIRPW